MRRMGSQDRTRIAIITMGCSKNVVDSEQLAGYARGNAFELAEQPSDADVVIINTCGFIDAAKEESIGAILEAVALKGTSRVKKVFVAGCLTERFGPQIRETIPEVDGVFGSADFGSILTAIRPDHKIELLGERVLSTPAHFAYLKIAEGCDHPCAFCAIPLMRGTHRSRPMEEIVSEARNLAARGVRELIVIAQDSTYYGVDSVGTRQLPELLRRISDIEELRWIRLMYAFPSHFPMEVFDIMRERPNVCNYIDMPVQHASDEVLRSMRRGITRRATEELIGEARARVPGITLRTTLIAGFPSETPAAFGELEEFVGAMKFDRLGVFTYSHEEGTSAFALDDCIPQEEKDRRRDAIMALQQEIAGEKNLARIGGIEEVVIDECSADVRIGRTERDAPEIDNTVIVGGAGHLRSGDRCRVLITGAMEYDVTGELA
jgi:ribosomal protein S12 methylthiotransferase